MLVQKSIIADMPIDLQKQVHMAFAILSQSGLWDSHIQLEKDLIFKGAENESPEALAVRILEARKRVNALTELQTLGLETQKG